MHATTTTTAPGRPGGHKPFRPRNAAIAALGIMSAPVAAAGGGGPVPPHAPAASAAPAASGAVTISLSVLGREGVIEIRFAEKPAPEVLAGRKAHGFRWARRSRCWYGRDRAHAENLAK